MTMKSLTDLIQPAMIESMTLPSNFKYGSAIYERGAVEFIEFGPTRVEAWAGGLNGAVIEGGGSRRRVELTATSDGLKWHCTGNPKTHQIFCKHCIATALAVSHKPIH